ncbi:MAG: ATP-binding cassette domain-containing protein [Christensenellaceae bacterium]|nr:ATP-binding cassette domain-containing protein [Christensenellaceae bacterium]
MSLEVCIKKRLGKFLLDVELHTEPGVMGLLGASGSGKTVTLMCIAGILRPDEGRILLNGRVLFDSEKRIDLPPQQRRVGYLFQNYALFPNMTVERNIACGLCREKDRAARKKAVADIISRMRLTGLEKHRPHQLSGGQQQRVALARILVGQPELLRLDEPLSALDSHLKDQLVVELRHLLKSYGRDALLVTHSRDEAYRLCNTLAVMEEGRLLGMGDTREFFADPGTRTGAALTGCKNIVDAKKAGETSVYVPDWGVTLDAGKPVGDHLVAIGIRAHHFGGAIGENSFPIRVVEEIEEPFEWTVKFMYETQQDGSMPVWWRMPKAARPERLPERLGVSPENILLLYG